MLAILLGLAVLLGSAYLGAAAVVYENGTRVAPDCDGNYVGYSPAEWSPPRWATEFDPAPYFTDDFETVHIPSRDEGIELNTWWLPAADPEAPAVVLIPGRAACVRHPETLAPAAMLHRLGYNTLLIDLRDHGSSTIEDGRYAGGMEEYRDVMGAVDWLLARKPPPRRVGVLGTSLGGATAVIAGGVDERVAAVWTDSSYSDMQRRVEEELEQRGFPTILAPAGPLVAWLISGDDWFSHTVLGETEKLAGRALFITHGEEDMTTYVQHAYDLLAAAEGAGVEVDSWIVPEAGHVAAMFLYPDEYERRLGRFFGDAFDEPASSAGRQG
jgi:fermentation-respiration switch protein FrsA (DUF1100 family)